MLLTANMKAAKIPKQTPRYLLPMTSSVVYSTSLWFKVKIITPVKQSTMPNTSTGIIGSLLISNARIDIKNVSVWNMIKKVDIGIIIALMLYREKTN